MSDIPNPESAITTPPATPPIAPPVVSSAAPVPIKESGPCAGLRAGNTPRLNESWRDGTSHSSRTGRKAILNVRHRLSERDMGILWDVASHRFLTTRHVRQFRFADHTSPHAGDRACRHALQRLSDLRLLTHLDRRVGGVRAGSASFVWTLDAVGDRLLRLGTANATRQRLREPSTRFLDHCLAIADAHLAVVLAERDHRLELIQVQTEPACWRRYTGLGGAANVLQPDLYLVTGAGEFEDHWMIEVDLGNEHLPTLISKCRQYIEYLQTGTEQADGGVFPVVVWMMSSADRVGKLQAALDAANGVRSDLFRVTTPEDFINLISGGAL